MREITELNEVVDRLLENNFNFWIEDDKLFINSYLSKNANPYSALGFYYCGVADKFFYDLKSNCIEIQSVISDAFLTYKRYVETYIKDTMSNMLEGLK